MAARVVIDIEVNGAGAAANQIDSSASKFDKFSNTMGSLAVPAGAAATAIVALGKVTSDAASATQQAMGAVDSVFGTSADKIKAWSETAATSVGLSQSQYGQLAAVAGASLKSMGLSADAAADQTGSLITLGADLAATMGGTTADAVDALTSALRGEADPAERLGLNLKQSTVAAQMAADGTDQLTGSALDAAKASTIMKLATEQAAGANGQFAREADSAAGSQQIANAQLEDAKSAMGEALLPVVVALSQALGGLSTFVQENTGLITGLVVVVGALAAGVLIVNGALALYSAAQAVATAAQWAWNAAMSANPIALIIIAIVAVVAAFVLLWNKCDAFREFFTGLWEKLQAVVSAAWDAIKAATEAVWNVIKAIVMGVIDAIKWYFETYFKAIQLILNGIQAAAEFCWNAIKAAVSAVIDWAKSAFDGFKNGVVTAFNYIKDIGSGIWDFIRSAAQTAINAIMVPVNAVKSAIDAVINAIKSAISWASNLASKIPIIGGLFSSSKSSAPNSVGVRVGASPSLAGRAMGLAPVTRAAIAGGAHITVNGALDPVAVARQISLILRQQERRTGAVRV